MQYAGLSRGPCGYPKMLVIGYPADVEVGCRRSSSPAAVTDAGVDHTADGQHREDADEKSPPVSMELQQAHRADHRTHDRQDGVHPPGEYPIPVRSSC